MAGTRRGCETAAWRPAAIWGWVLLISCSSTEDPVHVHSSAPIPAAPQGELDPPAETDSPSGACEKLLSSMTPGPEAVPYSAIGRAHVVFETSARARVYFSKPRRDAGEAAEALFTELHEDGRPRRQLRNLKKRFRDNKPFLREILLSDGYLFETQPTVASALVKEIDLTDLFDEPVIYRLHRGKRERLTRREEEYLTEDWRPAKLVLSDRVARRSSELDGSVHLDLDDVARETGAVRIDLRVLGTDAAWVDLHFPSGETRGALAAPSGDGTEVQCIGGDPGTLEETLSQARSFWEAHDRLVAAAEKAVEERPRFDEPLDEAEDVQEDGDLRLEWYRAYQRQEKVFLLRDVEYPVFDRFGNPTPPQVCVDFIFDTWERASGTWYRKKGKRPGKSVGGIDFSALPEFSRRHIPSVLTYSAREEAPFDRYDIHRRRWIPYEKHRRFMKNLLELAPQVRVGDMLVIHGLRDEDMQEHFHAVLVLETDPLTGIPTRVADNQGRPRIWSLSRAMGTAPKRAVKHRLRLRWEEMARLTQAYREATEQNL